ITAGKAAGLTVFAKREERFGFTQEDADAIIDRIPDILDVC
ncbi:MAG: HAD family phosphatase, partial [Collinsella sp.]|nr:HAD family phosphatase [Collinsella sp.]